MRYIIVLLFLTGCATASPTYTPSGKQGFSIDCSGAALGWGLCYQKAGEMCGSRGYKVLAQNQGGGLIAGPYTAVTTVSRTLLVECN